MAARRGAGSRAGAARVDKGPPAEPVAGPAVEARNEVVVVGRLPAEPLVRELPSGDALVTFRIVVPRPGRPAGSVTGRGTTVDTIDCAAWTARIRRSALKMAPGDTVEIQGALRRRFWRSPQGAASRTEVEVTTLRVLSRVSRRAATA